ncbi:glyoxylase-like metal-dependent hydrolase (beta-lactamase superfamily II) [Sulfitobacter undariae]|uniref:Glyoxylase-like metal-dependent hydrolase (Beta-lactamase superfamily II) n=1 Tax=Sulfitobacter undariae TaxID=1563671 RepID=A0A7W6E302_9RHOB|nr:MBL fold metallo-hydrolase [Sulfitobacter undariae]MBB3993846.1 glyoxylase-like metal-dependent hydrolase (beta-lactamase superfamily II) [Sulfitobacter undariae]
MPFTRRKFMASGASITAGAALGLAPFRTHAEITLGDIRLDVVSDGTLTLPSSATFGGLPQDQLAPIRTKYGLTGDVITPPCNITLMRRADRTILFDVGAGSDFMASTGQLLTSLDALAVAPEDVTDIVFTHAHPDHLWGVLDDFDDPLFPNAAYMIGQVEWDYWMNPNTVDEIGAERASFAVGAQRRLAMLEDQISFINDGEEIISGVAAHATFGHTPGHMSFEIKDGSNSVMVLGDCIGNHHVAFEQPAWIAGSDQDGEQGVKTRLALLDKLASEKTQIIGFHLAGGGMGYVDKTASGYAFVAGE